MVIFSRGLKQREDKKAKQSSKGCFGRFQRTTPRVSPPTGIHPDPPPIGGDAAVPATALLGARGPGAAGLPGPPAGGALRRAGDGSSTGPFPRNCVCVSVLSLCVRVWTGLMG